MLAGKPPDMRSVWLPFLFPLYHGPPPRPSGSQRVRTRVQEGSLPPSRGPDGQYRPVAQVEPMEDGFIGGWPMDSPGQPSVLSAQPDSNGNVGTQLGARTPSPAPSARFARTGYPFVRESPPSHPEVIQGVRSSFTQNPLSQLSPVERSHALNVRKRTMNPYLQYMCGPLLRYDTVDEYGVWHGAALIVSECRRCIRPLIGPWWAALTPPPAFAAADAGSTYEPYPTLKYRWDPKNSSLPLGHPSALGGDLGPHPADPMAQHYGRNPDDVQLEGPSVLEQRVLGTELYVFGARSGYVYALRVAISNLSESPLCAYLGAV
jgi:hypothetical protein